MKHRSYGRSPGRVTALALLVSLHACSGVPRTGQAPPPVTAANNLTGGAGFQVQLPAFVEHPQPGDFSICHGNTCSKRARISLSAADWDQVRAILLHPAATASAERQNIATAVALLENMVGLKSGTDADLGRDEGMGRPGQLDCVDEAINTTVYLTMLQNDGLLRFHNVGGRATRGPFTGLFAQWPHSTSVMRDTESGTEYAVDAWFLANGEPPFIVPMSDWWRGWRPPGL